MMLLQDIRARLTGRSTPRRPTGSPSESLFSHGDAVLVRSLSHFRIGLIESLPSAVTSYVYRSRVGRMEGFEAIRRSTVGPGLAIECSHVGPFGTMHQVIESRNGESEDLGACSSVVPANSIYKITGHPRILACVRSRQFMDHS